MAFFCRSMSRRRRASATLAWSATVPSGRILPSRSFSSARKSPMVCARRPRRGKRSAAAVSSDLASAARSSSAKRSKISLGSRLAPSMRSLWTAGFEIGQAAEKSMRMAAPRAAGCGRAARRRYSMASPASARSSVQPRAVGVRLDFFQLAAAQRAGDIAAQQLPQGFEFENFGAGFQAGPPLSTYIFGGCGKPFQSRPGCLR